MTSNERPTSYAGCETQEFLELRAEHIPASYDSVGTLSLDFVGDDIVRAASFFCCARSWTNLKIWSNLLSIESMRPLTVMIFWVKRLPKRMISCTVACCP